MINISKEIFHQDQFFLVELYLNVQESFFYLEDYLSALNQVEEVIKMFPSLAIAYARKGTVYYKMGDIQNATINWNLALKYDPEYTEVQNMKLIFFLKRR